MLRICTTTLHGPQIELHSFQVKKRNSTWSRSREATLGSKVGIGLKKAVFKDNLYKGSHYPAVFSPGIPSQWLYTDRDQNSSAVKVSSSVLFVSATLFHTLYPFCASGPRLHTASERF